MARAAGNIARSGQPNILFSSHKTTFKLPAQKATGAWIEKVIVREKAKLESLSYVFCTDTFLLKINRDYLDHDTLTDIITFDLNTPTDILFDTLESIKGKNVSHGTSSKRVEGEIYISIPRVRYNARKLEIPFQDELDRVIIHGVLHLLGYSDKTNAQKAAMREKEEACLSLR